MNDRPLRPRNQNRLPNHILHLQDHKVMLGDPKTGFSHHFHLHQRSSPPQNDQGFFSFVYLKFYLDLFAFICVYLLHKILKNSQKKRK
jgi:hypothetical protein